MKKIEISFDDINEINACCQDFDDAGYIKGGNLLLKLLGESGRFRRDDVELAKQTIDKMAYTFLERNDYLSAATLMFGHDYFDARPPHIQDLFRCASDYDKLIAFGASSMSKTYGLGIWLICDFLRDPLYTKVKLGAVNEKHLKENLFADMIKAIKASIVRLDVRTSSSGMYIRPMKSGSDDVGISGVIFPQDNTSSTGRLRGIKPSKRSGKPHPAFGKMGRVRILLDEASTTSKGVYLDLGSPESSNDGNGRVKIMLAFNPTDSSHWTADIAKPKDKSIDEIDPDEDYEWTSKDNWHVYRLDGEKSPNVIARKEVCSGVMTWHSMKERRSTGDSAAYWVYGRGLWMRSGHFSNVIPMDFLTRNRGELIFPEGSTNCGSLDVAYSEDKVIYTLGRWGLASGWRYGEGNQEFFMKNGRRQPRWSLQIDQQFEVKVPTSDSIKLANEIMKISKDMGVSPKWFGIDSTAIGKGVYDILHSQWGPVCGINWQEASSKTVKIFADDDSFPHDLYSHVTSEMWFGMKHWLEHGVMKIGPLVNGDPLFQELTNRRYKPRGTRVAVESKGEYKGRASGVSCDYADSLAMMVVLCRRVGDHLPTVSGDTSKVEGQWAMFDESSLVLSKTRDTGETLGFVPESKPKNRWEEIEVMEPVLPSVEWK